MKKHYLFFGLCDTINAKYTQGSGFVEGLLYISLNVFCIAELLAIFINIHKGVDKRMEQVMFAWFVMSSVILLSSDLVWGLFEFYFGWKNSSLTYLVNSFYHIFTGVVAYLWFLFSESSQGSQIVKSKLGIALSFIPLGVLMFLVVGSNSQGWVFDVTHIDSRYVRGPMYFSIVLVCFGYISFTSIKALIKSLKRENYLKKQHFRTLASFCVFPAIAGVLQVFFVGSPMISAGISFAAFQVYMSTREQLISVDPMTQLNNKKSMEVFLDSKIKSKPENKDLYVFIMDLDYFKSINDKYGHIEGDAAIVIAANTIREMVKKTNFFACRYGGDEFVIVCETPKEFKPKVFRDNLNELLAQNTAKQGKEYTLKFSVGYKKYSPEYKDILSFIAAADEGLYMIKNSRSRFKDML